MNLQRLAFFVSLIALGAFAPLSNVLGGDCSITEGPDTVGGRQAATESAAACIPDDKGNSETHVAFDPRQGWPLVVCARSAGDDRDIAFDEWRGDGWLAQPQFLTSSTIDEVDPRVHVDEAGNVYVVWWENGDPQSVLMVRRPSGEDSWERPRLVSSSGRRPSIVSWSGTVLVAFERDARDGGQELVVATAGALEFSSVVVTSVAGIAPLDALLQAEQARVWVEWDDADGRRVVSELRGSTWSSAMPRSWLTDAGSVH